MLVETDLNLAGYSEDHLPQMQQRMLDAAAAIPGDSNEPWHLTSAGWPAAPEDFYSF